MKREFDEYDDDKFENLEEAEQIYGAMAPLVKDVGKHGRQFKKAMETLAPLMEEAFPRKLGAVIYARLFKKWLRDGILEEDEKYLFERRAKNSAPFTPEELRRKKEVGNAANYIFNKLIAYVYGEPDVIGIKEGILFLFCILSHKITFCFNRIEGIRISKRTKGKEGSNRRGCSRRWP
jgi:hypothetical protein